MRLRRLDLTRYGKFTDKTIDFGEPADGTPDLHIIYGLNEAGKSTTFAAFLDLLFGIPERSPYNFVHPYSTMQIGAKLAFDGSEREFVRLKQRTGSLLDERAQPINEAMIFSALGGITRESYKTMFSLDDQSLKEGGNAIIQSKGELGELLFSASTGLAGLSKSLVAAAEDAGSIYKKRSSSTKLAELKRSLETLKGERNAIDTFAAAYSALKAGFENEQTSYNKTMGELAEARSRHAELIRLLNALPLSNELAGLNDTVASLGELPRPPSEWFSLLPQLSRDETRLQALMESADRNIAQLAEEIGEIDVDPEILAISGRIQTLDDGRARYRTADNDLPKRRLALAEQNGMLSGILADLEQKEHENPEALLLTASSTGVIRDLIEQRSGIDAAVMAAKRELDRTQASLARLEEDGTSRSEADSAADPNSLLRIETALTRLQRSDLPSRLNVEDRACGQLRRSFESQFAALAPWSGNIEALRSLRDIEPPQFEAWRSQAVAIEKRTLEYQARHRDLETDRTQMQARMSAIMEDGTLGDDGKNLRLDRDAAWTVHLGRLDLDSARTFEERMRKDDLSSERQLSRAQELAELRQMTQSISVNEATITRQAALLAEARVENIALSNKIDTFVPANLPTGSETFERIVALESWMKKRAQALLAWEALLQAQDDIKHLRTELKTLVDALLTALQAAGIETGEFNIDDLVHSASDLLSNIKNQQAAQAAHEKALIDLSRDLAERQRDHDTTKALLDEWQVNWVNALSKTWITEQDSSVAAVREILTVLTSLQNVLRDRQDMAQRATAMERDQAHFRDLVADIAGELGDNRLKTGDDALVTADALLSRNLAAHQAQQMFSVKQADLDRAIEERRLLEKQLSVHNASKAELTAFFDTDTLTAVDAHLKQVQERERVELRITDLRQQLVHGLRTLTFDAAEELLAQTDIGDVERSAMEIEARINDLNEGAKQQYARMTLAANKLEAVGGDDAVARIEAQRRTIFLEIEDLAIRYLTLRAGTLAAEQALHIYREKHRSSMMNRASEAFALITGGNYKGLAVRPDKDREILIGVAQDGSSKLSETMSTGTQFQLYLALRLAGYEEFSAVRPAVPFIADDIMESFDDPRSEEVFRLLGEMAKVGQVIYLTHHWHLCEIAKAVVPGVSIHQLG
jgi:uncharacterized protein YhaN